MKKWPCLVLCALLTVALLTACGGGETKEPETGEKEETVFVTETPYGDVVFPQKWEDTVKIAAEEEPYTLHFSAGDAGLFDLIFVEDQDGTKVEVFTYDLDKQLENYDDCCQMQEDVNVTLSHLTLPYEYSGTKTEDEPTFEIATDLVTLCYPERWKDQVTVETAEDGVKFSCGDTPVFDVMFGGEEGFLLGTFRDTEIRAVVYDVEPGDVSESEYDAICQMHEDINVILEHLMENANFQVNKG